MDDDLTEEDQKLIEWLMELVKLEQAGERTTIAIGPFTAYTLIGMLQLATRHTRMSGQQRKIARGIYQQLYPLFVGTPGEESIRKGEHPEWDK